MSTQTTNSKKLSSNLPCKFFSNDGCKKGDKCEFLHDNEAFAKKYGVHKCLTCDTNWCKGKRCADCRSQWHKCDTESCENTTRYSDLCFGCKGYNQCLGCEFWMKPDEQKCSQCGLGKGEKPVEAEYYQCGGYKCNNQINSGYKLCKECYTVTKMYTRPSHR